MNARHTYIHNARKHDIHTYTQTHDICMNAQHTNKRTTYICTKARHRSTYKLYHVHTFERTIYARTHSMPMNARCMSIVYTLIYDIHTHTLIRTNNNNYVHVCVCIYVCIGFVFVMKWLRKICPKNICIFTIICV